MTRFHKLLCQAKVHGLSTNLEENKKIQSKYRSTISPVNSPLDSNVDIGLGLILDLQFTPVKSLDSKLCTWANFVH